MARFTVADGAGRPFSTGDSKPTPRLSRGPMFNRIVGPDANSCAGCHYQPEIGGAGDFAANVFVGAQFSDPPVDSIAARVTNERNSTDLFGSGAVELLAAEMTTELQGIRDAALRQAARSGRPVSAKLITKGVISFGNIVAHPNGVIDAEGVEGVDYDLCVRPFGIKGIAASLREFSIAALNHHHGIQAEERFAWERTGVKDFDQDGVELEFTIGQMSALVLFQASLKLPNRRQKDDPADRGAVLFNDVGCSSCHIPKLRLDSNLFQEPNKFNRPSALRPGGPVRAVVLPLDLPRDEAGWYVNMYTDLKRHNMCDDEVKFLCNEERRQDNVDPRLFITARLWNLATSAPYCHRGDCMSLNEAILAHGGEGRDSRERYRSLSASDKRILVEHLKSLGAESAVR